MGGGGFWLGLRSRWAGGGFCGGNNGGFFFFFFLAVVCGSGFGST